MIQAPPAQPAVALGIEQTWPHVPQLFTLVLTFTSQPSEVSPLQLAYPALQAAITQVPPLQAAVAFGIMQRLPHAPQLFGFVLRFTSQPLAYAPSQLPYPA